jgi:hypothetical protein
MEELQKDYTLNSIIFASRLSVSRTAIVDFPVKRPQASPGLMTNVFPFLYALGTWLWPLITTSWLSSSRSDRISSESSPCSSAIRSPSTSTNANLPRRSAPNSANVLFSVVLSPSLLPNTPIIGALNFLRLSATKGETKSQQCRTSSTFSSFSLFTALSITGRRSWVSDNIPIIMFHVTMLCCWRLHCRRGK